MGVFLHLAPPQALGRPSGRLLVGRGQHHPGAAQPGYRLRPVLSVQVAQGRDHLDPEHEAPAELAGLGQPRLEARHLVEGGQLVQDHPDPARVVLMEGEERVHRDLQPGGDEPPQARVLVAPGGQEQEPGPVLPAHPVPDREGLARIGQELQRSQVRGEHGPDRKRGLGVVGVHDGLGHRALHGLGQGRQVGLEQVVDQDPVPGHPCFQSTPAPFENSCLAAVTQKGSTVSFCWGMRAAAIMSKSRGVLAS